MLIYFTGDKKDDKLHSGISLEVKSKKSKVRVHYQKFTRGKDISRYSEKDLANIFGKKTFKNGEETNLDTVEEDEKMTEQVFTEKGSMDDYFKNKLAALRAKKKGFHNETAIKRDDNDEPDFTFKGFSGTADSDEASNQGNQPFVSSNYFTTSTNVVSNQETVQAEDGKKYKKNKKDKKSKKEKKLVVEAECSENVLESLDVTEENQQTEKVKKSKKIKNFDNELSVPEMIEENILQKKKSKKKRKVNTIDSATVVNSLIEEELVETDGNVPKKKKKRKQETK